MKRIEPKEGQESVWDYPRPPKLEKSSKEIIIIFNGATVAKTNNAYRVLETSHPPVYYIPLEDINMEFLKKEPDSSFCEWKGRASYYSVKVGEKEAIKSAWFYESPTERFAEIRDYVAFYPSKMDECYVDGELVQSQEGDFYGGWITKDIVGPFKGGAGTWGW